LHAGKFEIYSPLLLLNYCFIRAVSLRLLLNLYAITFGISINFFFILYFFIYIIHHLGIINTHTHTHTHTRTLQQITYPLFFFFLIKKKTSFIYTAYNKFSLWKEQKLNCVWVKSRKMREKSINLLNKHPMRDGEKQTEQRPLKRRVN
jgi:hypothetical protein